MYTRCGCLIGKVTTEDLTEKHNDARVPRSAGGTSDGVILARVNAGDRVDANFQGAVGEKKKKINPSFVLRNEGSEKAHQSKGVEDYFRAWLVGCSAEDIG
jgi:hypothetical protein